MKIAIISPNNIKITPYIFFYYNLLIMNKHSVDVFYPERFVEKHNYDNFCGFNGWNSKFNIINYKKYRKWVVKKIKNNYDFIICLSMQLGFLLYTPLLKKHFCKRYIIDIRDFSYEIFFVYRCIEKKVIKNSCLSVISSPDFKYFLPKSNYLVAHNISFEQKENFFFKKNIKGPIVIAYIGSISYYDQCVKLINLVINDSRFLLFFYGSGIDANSIKDYIKIIKNERIKYYGSFAPTDKKNIILSSDILFNAYGNDSIRLKTALSNKLYDALYYKKPLLNSTNTLMSRISSPISFELDFKNKKILNDLYDWYQKLDNSSIDNFCNQMLDKFQKENDKTKTTIVNSLFEKEGKK